MRLITSQYREGARDPDHPLHREATAPDPARMMKPTAFHTTQVTVVHGCAPLGGEKKEIVMNKRRLHTAIVQDQVNSTPIHPLINAKPPVVHKSELNLPRETRRTLAQLRAQKCPLLQEYLHTIGTAEHPNCPLCHQGPHNTAHLFRCPAIPTDLAPLDLWTRPVLVANLLREWQMALEAG